MGSTRWACSDAYTQNEKVMKRHKFKIIIIGLLMILGFVGWFIPFEYNNEGYCSEYQLYRYQFGVYACEHNAETHPDFQCGKKMSGFWSYIGLEKLECEVTKYNSSFNDTINKKLKQDTLVIIKSTLQSDFDNFEIVDWIGGDINKDGKGDFVVLIDINGQRTICLIETLTENPINLKIVKQNNNLIECSDCGGTGVGDPYRSIGIKNGEITFKQLFGACCKDEESTTFKYNDNLKDWFLLKKEKISYCCNQEESDEIKTTITTETIDDFGSIKFSDY